MMPVRPLALGKRALERNAACGRPSFSLEVATVGVLGGSAGLAAGRASDDDSEETLGRACTLSVAGGTTLGAADARTAPAPDPCAAGSPVEPRSRDRMTTPAWDDGDPPVPRPSKEPGIPCP